jgi:hypothetical protein
MVIIDGVIFIESRPGTSGGGGCNTPPQRKVKKRGPTCGKGPWHAGICEIKDLFGELWNFLENLGRKLLVQKILGTFVFGNIVLTPPLEWKGPKFFNTPPPIRYRLARP